MSAAVDLELLTDPVATLSGNGWEAEVVVSDHNRRLQVLEHQGPDLAGLVEGLRREAEERDYGKVFLKAMPLERPALEAAGMTAEATIWGYFRKADAVVMSLFLDQSRLRQPFAEEEAEILQAVAGRPREPKPRELPTGYSEATATEADAVELAALYDTVFASYPFPITRPDYLIGTMRSHVVYRIIRDACGEVVAAASAEMSVDEGHAELTDFATRPDQRGHGLALRLLAGLEGEMAARKIGGLHTIARARSYGMNRVFFNRGWEMTGTLVNNCHIAGRLENMHVWCAGGNGRARQA